MKPKKIGLIIATVVFLSVVVCLFLIFVAGFNVEDALGTIAVYLILALLFLGARKLGKAIDKSNAERYQLSQEDINEIERQYKIIVENKKRNPPASDRVIQTASGERYSEEEIRRFIYDTKNIYSEAEKSLTRDHGRGNEPSFPVLFPYAIEDILQYDVLDDKKIKPILYYLFSVPPSPGDDVAYAAVDINSGKLYVESSRQVSKGPVLTGESRKKRLSYDKLHILAQIYQNSYVNMTEANWKNFVPESEREELLPCQTTERIFDESVADDCRIGIDRLLIKLQQRYGSNYFYLRRTTTGYRLYYGNFDAGPNDELFELALFGHASEELMKIIFAGESTGKKRSFVTNAREELDIRLNKDEFLSIYETAPDLFDGNFAGEYKEKPTPVSIYGDDVIKAVLWIGENQILCADYPNIARLESVMCKIGHNAYSGKKFEKQTT